MGTLSDAIRKLMSDWNEVRIEGDQRAIAITKTKLEEALMWSERI